MTNKKERTLEELLLENEQLRQENIRLQALQREENSADKYKRGLNFSKSDYYRLLTEKGQDIIFESDADGIFTFVSNSWTNSLGHAVGDVIGKSYQEFVHPDYFAVAGEFVSTLANKGQAPDGIRYAVRHINGTWRWHYTMAVPLHDDNDVFTGILGIARDITSLIATEQQLHKSTQLLNDVTQNMFDTVVLTDMTGTITYCSESIEVIGYNPSDFIAKNVIEFVHPDDIGLVMNELSLMMADRMKRQLEIRLRTPEGSYLWYDLIGMVLCGSQPDIPDRCIFSGRNINERKIAEESLKQNKEEYLRLNSLFRLMADNMPDMIWAKDLNKKFVFTNKAICRNLLNAVDTQEPIGKTDLFFAQRERDTHPENPEWHTFGEICVDSDAITIQNMKKMQFDEFGNVKGKFLFLDVHKAPLLNDTNELIGVVGSARDITIQKQADILLNETRQTYLDIFNTLTEAIYIIDESGTFIDVNKGAETMYGYSREEMIGQSPYTVAAPGRNDMEEILAKMADVPATGKPARFEFWAMRKNGEVFAKDVIVNKCKYFGKDVLIATARDISVQKQWEETILNYNRRMSLAADAARFGVWEYDILNKRLEWDDWMLKIYGLSREEFKGDYNDYQKFVHPDDLGRLKHEELEALAFKNDFNSEFRIIKSNGEISYLKAAAKILRDSNQIPVHVIGINYDITGLKRSEAIFKDIIEKNPMSIQILDMEGHTIQTNPAHTRLFGLKPPADYSIFKDSQLIKQGLGDLFEQIKNGEVVYFPDSYYNVHHVDPAFPDVSVWIKAVGFTLNDNDGKPDRIVLMHENITERKHAEAMFHDIIDKNPLSIQIVDKEGYTVHGNPACMQLFGMLPPPDFSIFADLEQKSEELQNIIARAKNGEVVHMPDLYYNPRDASPDYPDNPLWIRALLFPLNDSNGKPERFVLMHENITERKQFEQALMKAKEKAEESDRLKSAFLANMSHEIRTPMNGILGFAELLKEPELTGELQHEYIRIIEKSGARMLNIINDIIDISKIEAGLMKVELKESNINEQLDYIYTFFRPEVQSKGLQQFIHATLPVNEAIVYTDREKLYAILTNLVKNAVKYTNQGSIVIGYTLKPVVDPVKSTCTNQLEFFVRDTGIGIAKDRQEAIFERFVQADIEDAMARQGAGLGLAITKSYVEMLGGKIWVDSEEGNGSCFYFTLPYIPKHEKKEAVSNEVSYSADRQIQNLKIIIAEDDEASEMLCGIMMTSFARQILKVKTGTEAVEACRNNPDIDLILMDIQMPVMSGYEAARQIRQFNQEVFIIAQTAYGLAGDREKAMEAGCNEYISKPVNRKLLIEIIANHFAQDFK